MMLTTSGSLAPGTYPFTVSATSSGISHTTSATLRIATALGSLGGTFSTPTGTQNLTTLGTIDWAHWGLNSVPGFDHKANALPQISNRTMIGPNGANLYRDNAVGFTWSDGTPDLTANNTTTGLYVPGQGSGYTFTVPADATTRTLLVYVGAYQAQGQLTAHLSDGLANDYIDSSVNPLSGSADGLYTINYQAGSSGQTLTVTYTLNGGTGNVTLQAATLQ